MEKIRVLIVDDHEVVRLGIRTLINEEQDMLVVGEAGTAEEALQKVEQVKPDIAVLDIQLPGRSGLEVCRELRKDYPGTKVVILTSHADDSFVTQALRAGASGYILKQVGNEELMRAIRAVYRGEMALDPKTSAKVIAKLDQLSRSKEENAFSQLSMREMDVLNLVAQGDSNRAIGLVLNLSEVTVRNYISNILEKLQLRNRIELATFALENHLKDHMDQ